MIRQEDYLMIRDLRRKGMFVKDTAACLEVHPRTVSRALRPGGPRRDRRRLPRKSKLDPYNRSSTLRGDSRAYRARQNKKLRSLNPDFL